MIHNIQNATPSLLPQQQQVVSSSAGNPTGGGVGVGRLSFAGAHGLLSDAVSSTARAVDAAVRLVRRAVQEGTTSAAADRSAALHAYLERAEANSSTLMGHLAAKASAQSSSSSSSPPPPVWLVDLYDAMSSANAQAHKVSTAARGGVAGALYRASTIVGDALTLVSGLDTAINDALSHASSTTTGTAAAAAVAADAAINGSSSARGRGGGGGPPDVKSPPRSASAATAAAASAVAGGSGGSPAAGRPPVRSPPPSIRTSTPPRQQQSPQPSQPQPQAAAAGPSPQQQQQLSYTQNREMNSQTPKRGDQQQQQERAETLATIAAATGCSVAALRAWNKEQLTAIASDNEPIPKGTRLRLPEAAPAPASVPPLPSTRPASAAVTTLASLARQFGVSVQELRAENTHLSSSSASSSFIGDNDPLPKGMQIHVPLQQQASPTTQQQVPRDGGGDHHHRHHHQHDNDHEDEETKMKKKGLMGATTIGSSGSGNGSGTGSGGGGGETLAEVAALYGLPSVGELVAENPHLRGHPPNAAIPAGTPIKVPSKSAMTSPTPTPATSASSPVPASAPTPPEHHRTGPPLLHTATPPPPPPQQQPQPQPQSIADISQKYRVSEAAIRRHNPHIASHPAAEPLPKNVVLSLPESDIPATSTTTTTTTDSGTASSPSASKQTAPLPPSSAAVAQAAAAAVGAAGTTEEVPSSSSRHGREETPPRQHRPPPPVVSSPRPTQQQQPTATTTSTSPQPQQQEKQLGTAAAANGLTPSGPPNVASSPDRRRPAPPAVASPPPRAAAATASSPPAAAAAAAAATTQTIAEIAQRYGVPEYVVRQHNPQIAQFASDEPLPRNVQLRIPEASSPPASATSPDRQRPVPAAATASSPSPPAAAAAATTQTIAEIAQRYGVPEYVVRQHNPQIAQFASDEPLPRNVQLRIPETESTPMKGSPSPTQSSLPAPPYAGAPSASAAISSASKNLLGPLEDEQQHQQKQHQQQMAKAKAKAKKLSGGGISDDSSDEESPSRKGRRSTSPRVFRVRSLEGESLMDVAGRFAVAVPDLLAVNTDLELGNTSSGDADDADALPSIDAVLPMGTAIRVPIASALNQREDRRADLSSPGSRKAGAKDSADWFSRQQQQQSESPTASPGRRSGGGGGGGGTATTTSSYYDDIRGNDAEHEQEENEQEYDPSAVSAADTTAETLPADRRRVVGREPVEDRDASPAEDILQMVDADEGQEGELSAMGGASAVQHHVTTGDETLQSLARTTNVPEYEIRQRNPEVAHLHFSAKLPAGTTIELPGAAGAGAESVSELAANQRKKKQKLQQQQLLMLGSSTSPQSTTSPSKDNDRHLAVARSSRKNEGEEPMSTLYASSTFDTMKTVVVEGDRGVPLRDLCDEHFITEERIRELNPFLRRYHSRTCVPGNTIVVLDDNGALFQERMAKQNRNQSKSKKEHVIDKVNVTLSTMCERFKLSERNLRRLNPHLSMVDLSTVLPIGTVVVVSAPLATARSYAHAVDRSAVVATIGQRMSLLLGQRYFSKWRLFASIFSSERIAEEIGKENNLHRLQLDLEVHKTREQDLARRVSELRMTLDAVRQGASPTNRELHTEERNAGLVMAAAGAIEDGSSVTYSRHHSPISFQQQQQQQYSRMASSGGVDRLLLARRSPSPKPQINSGNSNTANVNASPSPLRTHTIRNPVSSANSPLQRMPSPLSRAASTAHSSIGGGVATPTHSSKVQQQLRLLQSTQNMHNNSTTISVGGGSSTVSPFRRSHSLQAGTTMLAVPQRGQKPSLGVLMAGLKVTRASGHAAAVGIKAGDVVKRVNGVPVANSDAFRAAVAECEEEFVGLTLQDHSSSSSSDNTAGGGAPSYSTRVYTVLVPTGAVPAGSTARSSSASPFRTTGTTGCGSRSGSMTGRRLPSPGRITNVVSPSAPRHVSASRSRALQQQQQPGGSSSAGGSPYRQAHRQLSSSPQRRGRLL